MSESDLGSLQVTQEDALKTRMHKEGTEDFAWGWGWGAGPPPVWCLGCDGAGASDPAREWGGKWQARCL